MSILIKGMEMPESCWGCCCENDAICQALALLNADSSLYEVGFHEVRPDCPLVEAPTPHGRLIDADKLRVECYHTMDELMKSTTMNISAEALSLLCGFTMIGEAPTILEAEK